LENTYFENGQLENEQLETRHSENDIWKMKNIQHGLVLRGCPASGQFQNSF